MALQCCPHVTDHRGLSFTEPLHWPLSHGLPSGKHCAELRHTSYILRRGPKARTIWAWGQWLWGWSKSSEPVLGPQSLSSSATTLLQCIWGPGACEKSIRLPSKLSWDGRLREGMAKFIVGKQLTQGTDRPPPPEASLAVTNGVA